MPKKTPKKKRQYPRKTEFRWYYNRGGRRHLTKRAKAHLSAIRQQKKIKKGEVERLEEQYEEREQFGEKEYVYGIKLIYNSPRGSNHDVIVETTLHFFSDIKPNDEIITKYVLSHIDELHDDFAMSMSTVYNDVVVGYQGEYERKGVTYFDKVDYERVL